MITRYVLKEEKLIKKIAKEVKELEKNIEIGFDDEDSMVLLIKKGIMEQEIQFTDDLMYKVLEIDRSNLRIICAYPTENEDVYIECSNVAIESKAMKLFSEYNSEILTSDNKGHRILEYSQILKK